MKSSSLIRIWVGQGRRPKLKPDRTLTLVAGLMSRRQTTKDSDIETSLSVDEGSQADAGRGTGILEEASSNAREEKPYADEAEPLAAIEENRPDQDASEAAETATPKRKPSVSSSRSETQAHERPIPKERRKHDVSRRQLGAAKLGLPADNPLELSHTNNTNESDDAFTLDQEIRDLRFRLAQKLAIQNAQLVRLLKRYD
jgi:hypothetical protein